MKNLFALRENPEPVTAFVVHWNEPLACAATVRALLAQGVPLQVVIVDNASRAEAIERLRGEVDPGVEIMRLPVNQGWGPALNTALRKWMASATNRYCLICAHDATPAADCLKLLITAMDRDRRIGIACPQYPDETVPRFSSLRGVQLHAARPGSAGSVQSVDVPHGTLMMLARDCLAEIGLFDERYFAYGDEHELGARAVRRGWTVALVWGAIVTNPKTSTPSVWRSYFFARNSLLLVREYHGRSAAALRAVLLLANTLRLLIASPKEAFAFSARARCKGVYDYLTGRYGPPDFSAQKQRG